jgi:hypothetical protein
LARSLIPLITGQTIFENNIQIPFRRASGGFNTTVRLEGVFATTSDGLCGSGVQITTKSDSSVGCLESVVNEGVDNSGWTALSRSNGKAQILENLPKNKATILGVGWRLHTFQVSSGSFNLLPSIFTIPEDVVFVQLQQSSVESFAVAGVPIFVKCDRAEWIERTCGIPTTVHKVERGIDGLFPINPCVDTDLLIAAVCHDSKTAFCQFTVKLDERTLLQYENGSGVFEIHDNGSITGGLLPGISRQIVGPRGPVQVYKDWTGLIQEVGFIKEAAKLIVKAEVDKEKVTLSLKFGDLWIPFSAEKYYADPEGFFTRLGIAKPEDGYCPEIVNFTEDGNVEVATDRIDLEIVKSGINVENTIDLPKELVLEQEFVLVIQNEVNIGVIVGGVLGGVVVIVGVVVGIVIWRRRRVKLDEEVEESTDVIEEPDKVVHVRDRVIIDLQKAIEERRKVVADTLVL